jgi:hypothetical protein
MTPPASLAIDETRKRMIGAFVGDRSTRLLSCTPPKVSSGVLTVWPATARPVLVMPDSHRSFGFPSPGSLKTWLKVQRSTSR